VWATLRDNNTNNLNIPVHVLAEDPSTPYFPAAHSPLQAGEVDPPVPKVPAGH
jgi:hypothetical protein